MSTCYITLSHISCIYVKLAPDYERFVIGNSSKLAI